MDSCSLQLREEWEMWEGSQALVRRAAVFTCAYRLPRIVKFTLDFMANEY